MKLFTASSCRRAALLGALTILALALAATAGAVSPLAGRSYHGTLPDYLNNAPHWTRETTGTVTVHVSRTGAKVATFSGSYFYYCGAGVGRLTGRSLRLTARGTYSGTRRVRARYGIDYYALSLRFRSGGRRLDVSYLSDFVATGQHIAHPYSTRFQHTSCESWVHGTLAAIG